MTESPTGLRWGLVVLAGWMTGIGCDAETTSKSTPVDIVLDTSADALGASEVTAAFLAVTSIELVPCADTTSWRSLFSERVARAHTSTTATRLGVPVLDSVAGEAKTIRVGTIAPPATFFCTVRVTFGPADGDSIGMPSDRAPVGRTLWVSGRALDTAGASVDFRLTSSEARTVDLTVPRFRPGDGGKGSVVHLSRPNGRAIDGVDLRPDQIASASRIVLDRLTSASQARVE